MKPKLFDGVAVATLTPYDAAGRLDTGLARAQAAWLAENGAATLAPAGTTGEFLFLSTPEKRALVQAVVAGVRGRARIIAGIWALDPAEITTLARAAEECGADAVFLTPPIYYQYDDSALRAFHRHVRAATALPVFAYNIPRYTGNPLSVALLEELAAEGTIQGVKDSMGKAERLTELVTALGERLVIMGASDGFAAQARALGADGFISALGNIYPRTFARIWNDGDGEAQRQVGVVRTAIKGYGGIAALKHLLTRRGFDFGRTRLPFSELSPDQKAALDAAVDAAGDLT